MERVFLYKIKEVFLLILNTNTYSINHWNAYLFSAFSFHFFKINHGSFFSRKSWRYWNNANSPAILTRSIRTLQRKYIPELVTKFRQTLSWSIENETSKTRKETSWRDNLKTSSSKSNVKYQSVEKCIWCYSTQYSQRILKDRNFHPYKIDLLQELNEHYLNCWLQIFWTCMLTNTEQCKLSIQNILLLEVPFLLKYVVNRNELHN